jgi:ferritin-like metal-binding protein YciE
LNRIHWLEERYSILLEVKNMSERQDTLQQYVSDMLAVERHILQPLETQSKDPRLESYPDAHRVVRQAEAMARNHIRGLEQRLNALGGDAGSPVKSAATTVMGWAASAIDAVRTDPVSKNLRDDYTALNLAAVGYTMLHTTGLALQDPTTAEIANSYLKDYTPLIAEINEVIPPVVVSELMDESEIVDPTTAHKAIQNTQKAWEGDHVHTGHVHAWGK